MAADTIDRDYAWLSDPARLTAFELTTVRDAIAGRTTATTSGEGQVRAEVVARLYSGLDEGWVLTPFGLRLKGATVTGALTMTNLCAAGGGCLPPLDLSDCRFLEPIALDGAHLQALVLNGARLPALLAKRLKLARGLLAGGCRCDGDIDLEDCQTGEGVFLDGLRREKRGADGPAVSLSGAVIGGDLALSDARLVSHSDDRPALFLDGADIRHVELIGAVVAGRVSAAFAKIAIQWNAAAARFRAPPASASAPLRIAVDLQSARIGEVFLNDARVNGRVDARAAVVTRAWSAIGARFRNAGDYALLLDGADIGVVLLLGAEVAGLTSFRLAHVRGVVDLAGARFEAADNEALNLFATRVGGGLFLRPYSNELPGVLPEVLPRAVVIDGQLDLLQTKITGDLALDGARLSAPKGGRPAGVAIDARSLEVSGSLWWRKGEGRAAPGTDIVDLLPTVNGVANFAGARIAGEVYLNGLDASFETPGLATPVDPLGSRARFKLETTALSFAGATIGGGMDLTSADGHATAIHGRLDLARATIGRDLLIDGVRLSAREAETPAPGPPPRAAVAVDLRGASVGKTFRFTDVAPVQTEGVRGVVDLGDARCGLLDDDDTQGWGAPRKIGEPAHGAYRVVLDGFVYAGLADAPAGAGGWLDLLQLATFAGLEASARPPEWARRALWIRRQVAGPRPGHTDYAPQPWRQLADVFRADGRDEDARHVAIAQYNFRLETGVEPPATAAWSWAVRLLFGYGYSPLVVALWFAAFLAAGWAVVGHWADADARYPVKHALAETVARGACARIGYWDSSADCYFLIAAKEEAKAPAIRPCEKSLQPPFYALDAFVPVNLKAQERCEINPARPAWLAAKYLYSLWGWIFAPLAALTFAGILKRE